MYHRQAQIAIHIRVSDHDQHDQPLDNNNNSSNSTEVDVAVTIKQLQRCQSLRAVVAVVVEELQVKRRPLHRPGRIVAEVVVEVTAATVQQLQRGLLLLEEFIRVEVQVDTINIDRVRKQPPGQRAAKRKQTPKGTFLLCKN